MENNNEELVVPESNTKVIKTGEVPVGSPLKNKKLLIPLIVLVVAILAGGGGAIIQPPKAL